MLMYEIYSLMCLHVCMLIYGEIFACVYSRIEDIYLFIYISALCMLIYGTIYVLVCGYAHIWGDLFMCLCVGMLMYWVGVCICACQVS